MASVRLLGAFDALQDRQGFGHACLLYQEEGVDLIALKGGAMAWTQALLPYLNRTQKERFRSQLYLLVKSDFENV